MEVDFVADQPGLALLHCHQQIHMDLRPHVAAQRNLNPESSPTCMGDAPS